MAEVQVSGPLADYNFEDDTYRSIFGSNVAIVGDANGSAFGLTLPPASDSVEVGSPTNASRAVVSGFLLEIPVAATQSLEIPASSNAVAGRTDLIVARLNPTTFTTPPGPVRLHRIAGTEGSATRPSYGTSGTGPRDLPLYAITRKLGEALTEADVVDLRWWSGPHFLVDPEGALPLNAPLGSTATRDGITWRRDFDGTTVDWIQETIPRVVLTGTGVATDGDDWDVLPASRLSREGVKRWANLIVNLDGDPVNPDPTVDGERRVARVAAADRPSVSVSLAGFVQNTAGIKRAAAGRIDPDGWVVWHWASTSNRFPTGSTITLTGPWELNA